MEKEQQKGVIFKQEIKKERVANYPYHVVSSLYSQEQDYLFLVSVEYFSDSTLIAINPLNKDMTKLNPITINLNNILSRRIVTTILATNISYKPTTNGVSISYAQFILGYMSGHLIVVECKGKECSIKQRLNKNLKGQSFLSKTSSFFFGEEENYSPYFKLPVKSFQYNPQYEDLSYSYQIGNHIFFAKQLNENSQYNFLNIYESNSRESFLYNCDNNTFAEKGSLAMFGCNEYYSFRDNKAKIGLIKFEQDVSSFLFLPGNRKDLAVALGSKDTILLIETSKYSIFRKIKTQMTIRRLGVFQHKTDYFLVILVYADYALVYNLLANRYCKLIGHKSFIAGIVYYEQEQMMIAAGMDHRVSLTRMSELKQNLWQPAIIEQKNVLKIEDTEAGKVKIPQIFSVGFKTYDNNSRTNLLSYGFADLFMMGKGYFYMPTFDARLMIYRYG